MRRESKTCSSGDGIAVILKYHVAFFIRYGDLGKAVG
jgi:hypothetical protein